MNGGSILIVEHDLDLGGVLKQVLSDLGLKDVRVSANYESAEREILKQRPAVLLLNTWIGDTQTALKLIQFVKELGEGVDPKIILMSSDNTGDQLPYPCLKKPFNTEKLEIILST